MKRISSKMTFFHRRIFPVMWIFMTGLTFALSVVSLHGDEKEGAIIFAGATLFMVLIGFILMKFLIWDLVDEVYDGQDFLLIKRGKLEDKIFLKDVMNVSTSIMTNPRRITLMLRKPSKFGSEITFQPPLQIWNWGTPQLVKDLILRIDKSRH